MVFFHVFMPGGCLDIVTAAFTYFPLCYMLICDIVYGCSETNAVSVRSVPPQVHSEREVHIRMKEILYKSTRSDSLPVPASKAILMGLAKDGGLFVPTDFPSLDKSLSDLAGMDYRGVAYEVMKRMLTDFTEDELKNCIFSIL